jgi:hypothetical protein
MVMRLADIVTALSVATFLVAHSTPEAAVFTLYRNSPLDVSLRVHWATFDVKDTDPTYNQNNCMMAARLLNANVTATAEAKGKLRYRGVGFWCEPGTYKEKGGFPASFPESFPTDG